MRLVLTWRETLLCISKSVKSGLIAISSSIADVVVISKQIIPAFVALYMHSESVLAFSFRFMLLTRLSIAEWLTRSLQAICLTSEPEANFCRVFTSNSVSMILPHQIFIA
ncbi:hypothetical protein [Vibrio phage 2E1]|nr:hypothetical protein [Vibrio phage 2E1]